MTEEKNRVGLLFSMPYGTVLEIVSSKEIPDDIDMYEEIEDVVYNVWWGTEQMPYSSKTKLHAHALAMGAQWAAKEMMKRICGP